MDDDGENGDWKAGESMEQEAAYSTQCGTFVGRQIAEKWSMYKSMH